MMRSAAAAVAFVLALFFAAATYATVSIPFPGPGAVGAVFVPIGTPQGIGHGGTTGGSSSTITTTGAIQAGDLVVVNVGTYNNGTTTSSVSDGTNSYTMAVRAIHAGANGGVGDIWYKANAAAVSSGATLTVTYAGAVTYSDVIITRVSGISTTSPLDANPAGNATGTASPTVASGTLAKANEILFGTLWEPNGGAISNDAAFSTITGSNLSGGGQSGTSNLIGYKVVAATTSVTFGPTASSTLFQVTNLVSFKGF